VTQPEVKILTKYKECFFYYSEDEQFSLLVNTYKHGQENETVKSKSKCIHEQYFV